MVDFDFDYQGVDFYPGVLDKFLNAPGGETGQYMHATATMIVIAAKAQVGVDTAELQNAIEIQSHVRTDSGQYIRIGADVGHALAHHEGTNSHLIARPGDQFLRFSKGGRQIYTHAVTHPGTQPNRYLSDNLRLVQR